MNIADIVCLLMITPFFIVFIMVMTFFVRMIYLEIKDL